MKENKKGFTLVELLAVIFILSLILLIAYPSFSKLTKVAESKYNNSLKVLAKSAAKVYVSNNREEVDNYLNEHSKYCLPLAKLAAYDFLNPNLKDISGNNIDLKQCVNVTKESIEGKTKYNYQLSDTDFIDDSVDYLPPTLILRKKSGSTLDCSFVMNDLSKESFNNNCEVIAIDNISSDIEVSVEESVIEKSIILKYTAEDQAGNKAIPLKVKLITN